MSEKDPISFYDEAKLLGIRGGSLNDCEVKRVDRVIYLINHYESGLIVNAHRVKMNNLPSFSAETTYKSIEVSCLQFELLNLVKRDLKDPRILEAHVYTFRSL